MTTHPFIKEVGKGLILLPLFLFDSPMIQAQDQPNVLVIVADDMGIDALGLYGLGARQPNTPNLDALAQNGLRFTNAWAYPVCSPTRAAALTGQIGSKTDVLNVPGNLILSFTTLFEAFDDWGSGNTALAAIGKWHLSPVNNPDHPNQQGVDHYVGLLVGGVNDYSDWSRTENGVTGNSTEYITSQLADEAVQWIDAQTEPWFLWHAHVAPHSPFHLPPPELYTRTQTNGSLNQYLCMIEAMDHEIGRVLDSIPAEEMERTLVIFFGDNGTPVQVLQEYPAGRGKGSLYQGGIHVPMIVSGYGVSRINETEDALVNVVDIYATLAELIDGDLPGGVDNSFSFFPLLSDAQADTRTYNLIDYETESGRPYAIRNDRYKLIRQDDDSREFYDLINDPMELTDLLSEGLTDEQQTILDLLATEATTRIEDWSCNDGIQNGDETGIDQGGTNCQNETGNGTLWALQ